MFVVDQVKALGVVVALRFRSVLLEFDEPVPVCVDRGPVGHGAGGGVLDERLGELQHMDVRVRTAEQHGQITPSFAVGHGGHLRPAGDRPRALLPPEHGKPVVTANRGR